MFVCDSVCLFAFVFVCVFARLCFVCLRVRVSFVSFLFYVRCARVCLCVCVFVCLFDWLVGWLVGCLFVFVLACVCLSVMFV